MTSAGFHLFQMIPKKYLNCRNGPIPNIGPNRQREGFHFHLFTFADPLFNPGSRKFVCSTLRRDLREYIARSSSQWLPRQDRPREGPEGSSYRGFKGSTFSSSSPLPQFNGG
ncbi:hypothetical protein AKJ51_03345 [candidate division MSBL1 archaeon SCGC-AAA382A20]|uniref:Uncharacterized protein n=1 Tax=candidate division MSBL1 archaeon SCGC-AAA382A20 TaxID=1698280 RepID=A0A133VJK5_9EURY|nr:hypothetical protein AKJ51_03345 [candidate division MSBL1 archaeon SCGC-AAA382A20]